MGIITSLVEANHRKKLDDINSQLGGYKAILTLGQLSPDLVKPETMEWAIDNIAHLAEGGKPGSQAKGGGKESPFKVLLKGLTQLNPSPGAPKPVGQQPEQMFRSPEEQQQYRQSRGTESAEQIGKEEKVREEAKNAADLKKKQEEQKQEDQYFDGMIQKIASDTSIPDNEKPDYIEAVNKHRYFLSGAAPRVMKIPGKELADTLDASGNPRLDAFGKPFNPDWEYASIGGKFFPQGPTKPTAAPLTGELRMREDALKIVSNPDAPADQKEQAQRVIDHLNQVEANSKTSGDLGKFRLGKARQDAAAATIPGTKASSRSAAMFELITGDRPAFGMGKSADRDVFNASRSQILDELGPEKIAEMRASYKAGSAELSQLMKSTGMLDSVESAFQYDIKNALDASREVPRSAARRYNTWSQFVKADLTDTPELAKFRVAAQTAANQYARIMVSAGRGSVTTDSARAHSEELLNTAMASGAFEAALSQMNVEAQNMTKGLREATARAKTDISGGGAPKPATSGEDRDYQGHKYHRDKPGDPWKLVK